MGKDLNWLSPTGRRSKANKQTKNFGARCCLSWSFRGLHGVWQNKRSPCRRMEKQKEEQNLNLWAWRSWKFSKIWTCSANLAIRKCFTEKQVFWSTIIATYCKVLLSLKLKVSFHCLTLFGTDNWHSACLTKWNYSLVSFRKEFFLSRHSHLVKIIFISVRLSDPVSRSLAKEVEYVEEKVVTGKGTVTVAWKGDRTKPALLTYHDLGLNHVSNFQVRI